MKFHPAAAIFPLLEGDELQSLADSIKAHGLKVRIKTHDGMILDGRNRMTACTMAGIEPQFEPAEVNGSVAGYVWAMNYHRRHLTDGAKVIAAAKYKTEVASEAAKKRQSEGGKAGQKEGGRGRPKDRGRAKLPQPYERGPAARDDAAAKFGVSGRTVDAGAKILKHGTPEVRRKLDLFNRDDYQVTIQYYVERATYHCRKANTLTKRCNTRLGTRRQMPFPGFGVLHELEAAET